MLVGVVVENFQKCRDLMEKDRLAEKEKKRAKQLQSGAVFKLYAVQNFKKLHLNHHFSVNSFSYKCMIMFFFLSS